MVDKLKVTMADFLLKAMCGVALFLIGQLYGIVPIVQPIVELSPEDQETLMDFGSPMMREQIEQRKKQFDAKRKAKR